MESKKGCACDALGFILKLKSVRLENEVVFICSA